MDERYAVVSCHVERLLDDRIWERLSRLQARRRIAALLRPPAETEDAELWLERAREAAGRGPLGHHIHWGGPSQARPTGGDPAARVRREGAWLRELLELPTTHSLGMLARALAGRLPSYVHLYFHDTDLLDRVRATTLEASLRVLALRSEMGDLDALTRRVREQDLPLNQAFRR